jgi:hypothetical protein
LRSHGSGWRADAGLLSPAWLNVGMITSFRVLSVSFFTPIAVLVREQKTIVFRGVGLNGEWRPITGMSGAGAAS